MSFSILIAAGGTGGHLFPAEALAAELMKQGYNIHLVTDRRGLDVTASHGHWNCYAIMSGGIAGKSGLERLKNIARLAFGFMQAVILVFKIRPKVAIGFGGYPSLCPLLAAKLCRAKIVIHEQNALAGRANRFLKRYAYKIAAGFPKTTGLGGRVHVTGNPARTGILELAHQPYQPPMEDIQLLITGGSQGAKSFSKLIPDALALLPADLQKRMIIHQQIRQEDLAGVQAIYEKLSLRNELQPFFTDMPARLAKAHLAITRAGASTLTELALAGRPAILIPLPNSIDGHQEANAKLFQNAGAAVALPEKGLTPEHLAKMIAEILQNPKVLLSATQAMRRLAKPGATAALAQIITKIVEEEREENGHARVTS